MKLGRKKVLLIGAIVGTLVVLWLGLSFLKRPPYRFMGNASLWFMQQAPNNTGETWAIYRTDTAFAEVYRGAVGEFGEPKEPPPTEPATPSTPNVQHALMNGKDYYFAPIAGRFSKGSVEILVSKHGSSAFQTENFMGALPAWPGSDTLIAIRSRTSVADRVQGWLHGIRWRGMSSDSGSAMFKEGSQKLPPEAAAYFQRMKMDNPVPLDDARSEDLGYLAERFMTSLEMGYFRGYADFVPLQIKEQYGISDNTFFQFCDEYLHPAYKLGVGNDGKTNIRTTFTPGSGIGKATEDFTIGGQTIEVSCVLRPDGSGRPIVDIDMLLINAWRIRALERKINKPFPQNVIAVAQQDMTLLATLYDLSKFPGPKPGLSMTWPEKIKWLATQTESSYR